MVLLKSQAKVGTSVARPGVHEEIRRILAGLVICATDSCTDSMILSANARDALKREMGFGGRFSQTDSQRPALETGRIEKSPREK